MIATAIPDQTQRFRSREIDARVGMMVFLGSWGMIFATLFFCCLVLRFQSPTWPPPGVAPLPAQALAAAWANTGLMVAGSLALWRLVRAIDRRSPSAARSPILLGFVMLSGAAFLGLQIETWTDLWRSGVRLQDGAYEGLFYAITTFHGVHVFVGLLLLIWAVPSAAALARAATEESQLSEEARLSEEAASRHRIRLRSAAMFWHFVDIAWLGTFAVVYLF